jgi:hypothetical protein
MVLQSSIVEGESLLWCDAFYITDFEASRVAPIDSSALGFE